jgi:hypothetical protein
MSESLRHVVASTSTVFDKALAPVHYEEQEAGYYAKHPFIKDGPVLHNRRSTDQFEYKVERVLQIIAKAPGWALPLSDAKREVWAEDLALIRVALREVGLC